MKNSKKLLAFLLSACMVCAAPAVISGCKDDGDGTHSSETEKNPEKLKEGVALSLRVGESSTITVSEYIKANGNTVTVNSSSNGVVTATLANGTLTVSAANEGTANVTLTCKSVTVTFNVTVAAQSAVTPVFDNLTKSLDLNLNTYVEVTLAPKSGADGLTFEYSQKNPSLIEGVEISGNTLKFTPSGTGSYEITVNAHCTNNAQVADVTFTVTVTVTQQAQVTHTVTIDGGAAQQYEHGYSLTLPTTTTQQAPNGKQFSGWKLGEGSTVSPGSTITVESDLVITPVFTDIPQQDPVKIGNIPDQELRLATGTFTTTVNLANYLTTNGHTVSVSSEDSAVATVGESGGTITITAVGAGATTVTVNCKDEQLTFNVTVKNALPAFDNGVINIDRAVSDTGTYEINPVGAATYSYSYSVTGATVSKDGEKDVLSYTATSTQDTTLTVNVTATDSATNAVENLSFTVQVNVKDTSVYRIVNGDFETGNLNGWTLSDPSLANGVTVVQNSVGYWGGTGAYNHGGTYHFNGQEGGIPEEATYTLTSSPFTLGGSGYISFKIGGRAAVVKIYDNVSGLLLAEYSNTEYKDVGIIEEGPEGQKVSKVHVELGARQAVMTTYVADLHEYLGLEVYLVLEDNLTGGWGHSIMDDVVTYYETAPVVSGKYDRVNNLCGHGGTTDIPWVNAVNKVPANRLQFTKKAPSVIAESGATDLTAYLSEAEAKLAGTTVATFTKQIVRVKEGTTDYTEGFTSFNLAAGKVYTVTYRFTSDEYSAEETFTVSAYDEYTVRNFSFETGDLTGWTYTVADGSVDFGRIVEDDCYWSNPDKGFNKEGKYLFTGIETASGGNQETGMGTLKSSTFTLKQNGWISFLLGGAHNVSCGLRVREAGSDTILAEFNNLDKGVEGTMARYKYQFTGMDGDKQCYIEIFDEATGDWGLVVVDDIHTEWGAEEPEGTLINSAK